MSLSSTPARRVLFALCIAIGALPAPVLAQDRPVVRACGHHDYPPWNWLRDGRIVGACASVVQRAVERLGYRVELSYVGPWPRCQAMVKAGQVDINICAFRNPERESYSQFVEPRMGQNRIAVFVRKDRAARFKFERWEDLAGLRTGLVNGVSMGIEFDRFLEDHTRVERAPQVESILKMMALDRVDIVPFGWEAGLIEIERGGLGGEIVPLAHPALLGDLYVSVSRKSPLVARIPEIAAYFARPGYEDELRQLLDESSRLYLQDALKPVQPVPVRPVESR